MAVLLDISDTTVLYWDKALGQISMPREQFDKNYIEDPPKSGKYRLRKKSEMA